MVMLAIDTSDSQASVALYRDGVILAELSWDTSGHHSRHVHLAIVQLLNMLDLRLAEVTSLVVASGPGSFSGLRVGVSFAKGLALALRVPLAGVSTLDVIGYQCSVASDRVCALMAAGRMQYYTAFFEGRKEAWRRSSEYLILSESDVIARSAGALLAGPAAATVASVATTGGTDLQVQSAAWGLRRAAFLAELGEKYFAQDGPDVSSTLEPLYLRRSSAEEKRAASEE